jgi:Mor family transcriptional regulator
MKAIYKKLFEFEQKVPILPKDAKGYGYSYTSLARMTETIRPILKEVGLGYTQILIRGGIKTVIFDYESAETLESFIELKDLHYEKVKYFEKSDFKKERELEKYIILGFEGMNYPQALGSIITYFRRYTLAAILGLVADEDADARNNKEKVKPPKEKLTEAMYNSAVKALHNGYTIERLRKKYEISKEQEETLKNMLNGTI